VLSECHSLFIAVVETVVRARTLIKTICRARLSILEGKNRGRARGMRFGPPPSPSSFKVNGKHLLPTPVNKEVRITLHEVRSKCSFADS